MIVMSWLSPFVIADVEFIQAFRMERPCNMLTKQINVIMQINENTLQRMKTPMVLRSGGLTSFRPILTTLSSTSFRETFELFKCYIAVKDDNGAIVKSAVTMYTDGPFANSTRLDVFEADSLGSTKFKSTYFSA